MTEASAPESPALGERATRGALVTIGAQLLRMGIQLASVVTLARLLDPHDYGLIAMVLAIIGVGEILRDFGLSSAAVQAESLSRAQRTTLFWLNTGIGGALALVVLLGSPLIAAFYGRPELVAIASALSVTFVFNGAATQYRASLVRDLRFTTLARVDITAAALALVVAIVGALAGLGYWALVAQQLTSVGALLVLLVAAARWAPGIPRRGTPVRSLVGFGGNVVLSQLIGYVSNNVDSVIIGYRFGAAPLGIYSRAFQLLMTPLNQVRSPLTSVALPVLSRLSAEPERFARAVNLGQLALGYSLVPALAIVIGTGESITHLFLGDEWMSAAPVLRLLAVAGTFQLLAFVGYWVYLSRSLTGVLVRYSLVSSLIRIVCVIVGSQWGIVGVAWGYAIAPALSWPVSLWWLSRHTPLPTARLYAGAGRILAGAALGSAAAWVATSMAHDLVSIAQVGLAVLAVALAYAALALVPAVRRDLTRLLALRRHLPRLRGRT